MKSTDRMILMGVAGLALVAAFWFLILAPKRQEASDLEDQVAALSIEVTTAEQAAAAGEAAKSDFDDNYRDLVSLGKAVPTDADTPSLLTQLQSLSTKAGVNFRSISLGGSTTGVAAAPAAAAPATPAPSTGTTTTTTTTTATATEASAALLPIGATVGPAGLPVMPYQMTFDGGFFEIADFFGSIDGMVSANGEKTTVDGRLMTIDGFDFSPGPNGLPDLTADVTTTTYLTPADQGITAGATPAGPAAGAATPATAPAEGADPAVSAAVVAN